MIPFPTSEEIDRALELGIDVERELVSQLRWDFEDLETATIYRQTYPLALGQVLVGEKNVLDGYVIAECFDCDGSGKFELPDGKIEPCNPCKGSGKMPVNV